MNLQYSRVVLATAAALTSIATSSAFVSTPSHLAQAGTAGLRRSSFGGFGLGMTMTSVETTGEESSSPSSSSLSSSSSSSASGKDASGVSDTTTASDSNPILLELRDAAMKLHTRAQSPSEGEAEGPERAPHETTRLEYLRFLIDSKEVFAALEEVVRASPELAARFASPSSAALDLERTEGLEADIRWMVEEYHLDRPDVGDAGRNYAAKIRAMIGPAQVPQFTCHYYNFYFAHTAGGRMIGKMMSKALLDGKTLQFYKWNGNINQIKDTVKEDIELLASAWTRSERDECAAETRAAFQGAGAINAYLGGAGH